MIQEEKPVVNFSTNDLIMIQLRDLKEGQRDLKSEIKDIRREMADMRKEMNDTRKELNERIDRLASKMDSSSNHGQIATISTIAIAVAVIYSLIK
ncbi:MAG: hypothetical protein IJK81_06995 [Selenomonadaceae bacterium]|nr:hypothetical protein [Selenomonadaceae bacterium]